MESPGGAATESRSSKLNGGNTTRPSTTIQGDTAIKFANTGTYQPRPARNIIASIQPGACTTRLATTSTTSRIELTIAVSSTYDPRPACHSGSKTSYGWLRVNFSSVSSGTRV